MAKFVSIDFETCSASDLRKTGVYRYCEDPTTRVLCMAWAIDVTETRIWFPGEPFPAELERALFANVPVAAWNAAFERQIWKLARRRYGFPEIRETQWRCTMVRAAYFGLPMSLDLAAQVMGGPRKSADGHRLMMKMCKPRAVDPFGEYVWWDQDPAEGQSLLRSLGVYCMEDVRAERGVGLRIPRMPDEELELWRLDQQINDHGVQVDLPLVSKMHALSKTAETTLNLEINALTQGEITSTGQVEKILQWLFKNNVTLPNLRSKTVAEALDDPDVTIDAPETALRVLEVRREAAKSSVKKLNALTRAVCADGRVRGMLQFYGAGRTGRWAGRIFQPQNLPRPTLKQVRECIAAILAGWDTAGIEAFFGPVMSALSSCIRGTLVARPGFKIMSVDYAQIEARVLAWLAGQQDILDIYASGKDVYTYDAQQIGSNDRQLGKVCRLGLGYGMGPSRFIETALAYDLRLDAMFADQTVQGWRANNKKIVSYWYDIGRAVEWTLSATNVGATMHVGRVSVSTRAAVTARDLILRLPSGRELVYLNARFDVGEISYDGMNQLTKKRERIRSWGGKFVENIVQAVARDLMANGLTRVVKSPGGLSVLPILTVHDEIIFETPELGADEHLKNTIREMTCLSAWASGLPLGAEGWTGDRYRK